MRADHVKVQGDELICSHCEERAPFGLPIKATAAITAIDQFHALHQHCEPNYAKHVARFKASIASADGGVHRDDLAVVVGLADQALLMIDGANAACGLFWDAEVSRLDADRLARCHACKQREIPLADLAAHIESCAAHPLSKLKGAIDAMRSKAFEYRVAQGRHMPESWAQHFREIEDLAAGALGKEPTRYLYEEIVAARELVHLAPVPFRPLCLADVPGQRSTNDRSKANCATCLAVRLVEPCMRCGRDLYSTDHVFGGFCLDCDNKHHNECDASKPCDGCRDFPAQPDREAQAGFCERCGLHPSIKNLDCPECSGLPEPEPFLTVISMRTE